MTQPNVVRLDLDVAGHASRIYRVLREPAVHKAWYEAASLLAAEIEAVLKAVSETRAAWHGHA